MTRSTLGIGFHSFRRLAVRAVLGFVGVQAAVVAALVITDALEKKGRVRRSGFPRPGTFEGTVAETDTTIYTYGEDLYADMLAAIGGARHRIFLETFIWKDDEVGRAFRDALNDAAGRGVEVYVTYDHFGNLVVPSSF